VNELGGRAIHVVADVSRRDDMQRVADTAIQRFGGFDTWINNAGLSIWGKLEEVSDEDSRRLFDINFWGVVYGSLVAVEHLKQHGGALINLGSVASDIALPLQGMYSASKHAIRGFTDALRMELEEEKAPISVTLIKPTSINTPFPQHAKNYMGKEPSLPGPVYPPEEVANAILHAATHPVRDVYVGGGGRVLSALGETMPRAMDWISEKILMNQEYRNEPPRNPRGTLFEPGANGQVHGEHPGYVMKTSLYTRASLHPLITGTLLAAVGLSAVALLASPRSRREFVGQWR
jgi:short-subunit dehydrogenase